jgi:hypothetical protein
MHLTDIPPYFGALLFTIPAKLYSILKYKEWVEEYIVEDQKNPVC